MVHHRMWNSQVPLQPSYHVFQSSRIDRLSLLKPTDNIVADSKNTLCIAPQDNIHPSVEILQ